MDAYHVIGDDLQLDGTGDLVIVTDTVETNQRILRLLITIRGAYFWNPTYGVGVGADIGKPLSSELYNKITTEIQAGLQQDDAIAKDPAPEVIVKSLDNGLLYTIKYYNLRSEKQETVIFKVT